MKEKQTMVDKLAGLLPDFHSKEPIGLLAVLTFIITIIIFITTIKNIRLYPGESLDWTATSLLFILVIFPCVALLVWIGYSVFKLVFKRIPLQIIKKLSSIIFSLKTANFIFVLALLAAVGYQQYSLQQISKALANLEGQVEQADSDIDYYSNEISDYEYRLDELEQANADYKDMLDESEQANADYKDMLDDLNLEIEELEEDRSYESVLNYIDDIRERGERRAQETYQEQMFDYLEKKSDDNPYNDPIFQPFKP